MPPPDDTSHNLYERARQLMAQGQLRDAVPLLEHALALSHQEHDDKEMLKTLQLLATLTAGLQQPHLVAHYLNQALDIARVRAAPALVAELHMVLGEVYAGIGETTRALAQYGAAQACYQAMPDPEGEGRALVAVAKAHQAAGDLAAAVPVFRSARMLLRGTASWTAEISQMAQLIDAFSVAASILGGSQSPRAGEPSALVAALRDQTAPGAPATGRLLDGVSSMREHLARVLDPQASGRLDRALSALSAPDADQRRAAARELGAYRLQAAIAPLWAALATETDVATQVVIVQALREYRDRSFTEQLRPLLDHAQPQVRLVAALALADLGVAGLEPYLLAGLSSADASLRAEIVLAVAQPGTSAAADALLPLLGDPDPRVRARTIQALGQLRDTRAVPTIIAATRDRYQVVRWAAVRVLGEIGAAEAGEALIAALADSNRDVRRSAATALGRLKDQRAVDALTRALLDEWSLVAESARAALRRLKAQPAPAVLLAQLHSDNPRTRRIVVPLLEAHLDQAAIPPLRQLLADADATVRVTALAALARLRDAEALPAMLTELPQLEPVLQLTVVEALGVLGDERAAPALTSLLTHTNPYVRYACITALGEVGTVETLPALAMLQIQDVGMVSLGSGLKVESLKTAAAAAMHRIRARYHLAR